MPVLPEIFALCREIRCARVTGMSPRHVLLAIGVAAIWGLNFVFLEVGLHELPPLFFVALRFVVVAIPAVFIVRRPGVSWKWIVLVGLPLGVGQFGLLSLGMHRGVPAGLSSLVLQSQVLFTTIFAAVLLRERIRLLQVVGMVLAFGGLGLAAADYGQTSPLLAFLLCVGAAAMWGIANIGLRQAQPKDSLSFVVWVSLVPPIPLLALSLIFEGPSADWAGLTHLSLLGIGSLLYVGYGATLVGYGVWGWLMKRHTASQVSMYSLLVPPFGISAAAFLLGERISVGQAIAAVLIIGGVALGMVGNRRQASPTPQPELAVEVA